MSADDYQKYLNKALRFLSYRSRSEKELRDYLQKKQAPFEIQLAIMEFLKERRFVNDEEFARGWIEQRLRVKPKARRIIEMELKQKGVAQEIIVRAFFINEHSLGVDDLETAEKLVEKKIDRYKDLSKQEIYQKLGGMLARKGFDWETIKKAIDRALTNKV